MLHTPIIVRKVLNFIHNFVKNTYCLIYSILQIEIFSDPKPDFVNELPLRNMNVKETIRNDLCLEILNLSLKCNFE